MPTIEFATHKDKPRILEITDAVDIFTSVERDCVEELWDAYQYMDEAGGYVFLIYRNAGRVLGYACFGRHSLTDGAFDLYWIAVDPAAQGRGIGRALLARVEAEIRYRNGYLVVVETSSAPPYAAARQLYQSSGYQCEAVIHDFYGRGDHLQVFVKDLALEPQGGVATLECAGVPDAPLLQIGER